MYNHWNNKRAANSFPLLKHDKYTKYHNSWSLWGDYFSQRSINNEIYWSQLPAVTCWRTVRTPRPAPTSSLLTCTSRLWSTVLQNWTEFWIKKLAFLSIITQWGLTCYCHAPFQNKYDVKGCWFVISKSEYYLINQSP